MKNEKIYDILLTVQQSKICQGVIDMELLQSFSIKHHTVSKHLQLNGGEYKGNEYFSNEVEDHFYRSPDCRIVSDSSSNQCTQCTQYASKEFKLLERKKGELNKPASIKAPISATSSSRLKATIQQQREENKKLENLVQELKASIKKKAVKVEDTLHSDLQEMFSKIDQRKITPFLKLFWEQQMDYLQKNPTQVK